MTNREIRAMIRRVSKRRHREMMRLSCNIVMYAKNHPYIQQSRARVERYGRELADLLDKLN